jgi:type 1 fimbriae regulatory protein FimB
MDADTIKWLTKSELEAFFKAIPRRTKQGKRDRALFYTIYRHGLRVSEATALRIEDIDSERMRLMVQRQKGSYGGEYPLSPDVWKAIKATLATRDDDNPYLFLSNRGTPLHRSTAFRTFQNYAAEAGIPVEKRHPHVLKHSIATHLMESNEDIAVVRDWLGHRNIQNTMVYAKITSRQRDQVGRRMDTSSQVL